MNRENGALVVEADDRVHIAAAEQPCAKASASIIGGETRREHKADSSAWPRKRHRPLEKQLVSVRVAARLGAVDPRIAGKSQHRSDVGTGLRALVGRPGVGANHVPGWVPHDRVESCRTQPRAEPVEEHFWKFEL